MKWRTNAKYGRFDGNAGPFLLEVVENRDGSFSWVVWYGNQLVADGVAKDLSTGADDAKNAAEDAVFEACVNALKGLRAT